MDTKSSSNDALNLLKVFECKALDQQYSLNFASIPLKPAILNLWATAHWWAVDLCLVGRHWG